MKHAGCARFAYNWGLEERIKRFNSEEGKARFTNYFRQHRELNRRKKSHYPWMYEVSKCAPQEALRDLQKAFTYFWRGRKKGKKVGFPKFKKKGRHDSFKLLGIIRLFEKSVQLPRIGKLRLKEKPGVFGRILSATISRKASRWFISFTVEQERPEPELIAGPKVGVDLGIKKLATLSCGTVFQNPRPLPSKLRKLRRLYRQISRKQKGSKNREKAVARLSRLHWRISTIRLDSLHKLTTFLAKNHSQIIVEDLNVQGMMKNKHLSQALSDVSFSEFRRQLEYKTKWYGSKLTLAPRFFPSSKRCSQCGKTMANLSLSTRLFSCEHCGLKIDRDLNASLNLESVAASWAETRNACLEMGGYRPTNGQCPSMMQEPNTTKINGLSR